MPKLFKQQTEWVVITGAPSSGKTSVVEALALRGYPIQGEVARELIEEGLHRGQSLDDVRRDNISLQRRILTVKHAREMALDPASIVFMDRGMPDSLSYYRLAGLDTTEAAAAALDFKYRAVFIFDRLPLVRDGVRSEDEAIATALDRMIEEDYRSLGYAPVRVPVMPIAARTELVLETLGLPIYAQNDSQAIDIKEK